MCCVLCFVTVSVGVVMFRRVVTVCVFGVTERVCSVFFVMCVCCLSCESL